jgi:Domain of unknown function (DUF5615)
MLRLLIDENFNQRILRGLRLRVPSLDYVVVQETDMQGLQDAPLLQEAAVLQRVLVTHDLKTVPRHAYARVATGELMPGIIAVPDDLPIGRRLSNCTLWWDALWSVNWKIRCCTFRCERCTTAVALPGPSPQGTSETLPSPILRRMSSTSQRRAAPRARGDRQRRRAAGVAA